LIFHPRMMAASDSVLLSYKVALWIN